MRPEDSATAAVLPRRMTVLVSPLRALLYNTGGPPTLAQAICTAHAV